MQVTEAQYIAACHIAVQVYGKQLSAADGIRILAETHGLNRNSARDFIDDYRHLARGEVFQRAMSGAAMKYFMARVVQNEGNLGRANAIKALKAHIAYYEKDGKRTQMMRSVLAEFQASYAGASSTDDVVESAISEINNAVAPIATTPKGQGIALSAAERRLIELAAMQVAEQELQKLGFSNIENVASSESFDFSAVLDGERWFVEVKGTTSTHADQILLTANEVDLHQEHPSRSCLIVVIGILLDRTAKSATGGTPVVFKPWGTAGWELLPTAYRAVRVPPP